MMKIPFQSSGKKSTTEGKKKKKGSNLCTRTRKTNQIQECTNLNTKISQTITFHTEHQTKLDANIVPILGQIFAQKN